MTKYRYKVMKNDTIWKVVDSQNDNHLIQFTETRDQARTVACNLNAQMEAIVELNESIVAA